MSLDKEFLLNDIIILNEIIERRSKDGISLHNPEALDYVRGLKAIEEARDHLLIAIGKMIETETAAKEDE